MNEAQQKALLLNSDRKVLIVFFDEINTNENVSGILKEILIDRRLEGCKITDKIRFVAACNPYKLKDASDQCITGGIRLQMLQEDINYRLVYRVQPFPIAYFNYIHNYNTLEPQQWEFNI